MQQLDVNIWGLYVSVRTRKDSFLFVKSQTNLFQTALSLSLETGREMKEVDIVKEIMASLQSVFLEEGADLQV